MKENDINQYKENISKKLYQLVYEYEGIYK